MNLWELFAGGGMARLGFGHATACLLANEVDDMKCGAYRRNFPGRELLKKDIASLSAADLRGRADVVWASPPCQDLSEAGRGADVLIDGYFGGGISMTAYGLDACRPEATGERGAASITSDAPPPETNT